jgi:hypothetical protein
MKILILFILQVILSNIFPESDGIDDLNFMGYNQELPTKTMSNIDYISYGYNVFKGNPQS